MFSFKIDRMESDWVFIFIEKDHNPFHFKIVWKISKICWSLTWLFIKVEMAPELHILCHF